MSPVRRPPFNILFLCTGNSARSILAEALANHPAVGTGLFKAYSAGSRPKGEPHPLALETLRLNGIATAGLRSKSWDEFSGADAPGLDFIISVCASAAGEPCPYWPGHPTTAHWGVDDPPAAGDEAAQRKAFQHTFVILKGRISRFAALPFEALDAAQIAQQAELIGIEF